MQNATQPQTPAPARRRDPLEIKPDPADAAEECRALIRAHLDEGGDLQAALRLAVRAFGLPSDFVETEGGRWH